MSYKLKFLLILLSSGFFLYFVNTTWFPIAEQHNSRVSQYWFQQAYFRNEIHLYTDKIREKKLFLKLKTHSKDLKNKNNISVSEYLDLYDEYIFQMQQLSRMILELTGNAQFIINDITLIIENLDTDNFSENDIKLIRTIKKSIENLTLFRDKIEKQNKEIEGFILEIKKQSIEFNSDINKLSNENNTTKKVADSVMAEIPLIMLIRKIKYNSKFGLNEPDYLLKPIRDYGEETISLNTEYNELLSIYNKQVSQDKMLNKIANYLVYLLFIGFLFYEVKVNSGLRTD